VTDIWTRRVGRSADGYKDGMQHKMTRMISGFRHASDGDRLTN